MESPAADAPPSDATASGAVASTTASASGASSAGAKADYASLERKFLGACLIVGPALIVLASFIFAGNVGSATGRWYDQPYESFVSLIGWSFLAVGFVGLARIIGRTQPRLAIATLTLVLIGTGIAAVPDGIRMVGSLLLEAGATTELLDKAFGNDPDFMPMVFVLMGLAILILPLSWLMAAVGLWRSDGVPKWTASLLALGIVLFMYAQNRFEVDTITYVLGVLAWLGAFAPIGWWLMQGELDGT